jgi:hypothetical protein
MQSKCERGKTVFEFDKEEKEGMLAKGQELYK